MKVTGETFSLLRRRAEEARYQKYLNFQAKGLLSDRTLESFGRSTEGAIPNHGVSPYRVCLKRYFLIL
jgi:hypothetical protein